MRGSITGKEKEVRNYGLASTMTPKPNSKIEGTTPNTQSETHREGEMGEMGPVAFQLC